MTRETRTNATTTARTGQESGDPLTLSKEPHAAGGKPPSKLGLIVRLLEREGGVSLAELVAATGWQPHSVRGALAGALRRKGHAILSEKTAGARRYRIEASE